MFGMLSPVFVHAQSVNQMSPDQIKTLLISLMEEVVQLEQKLLSLQQGDTDNATHTVTIQSSASPHQIVVTQNQTDTPVAEVQTTQPPNNPVLGATPTPESCTLSVKPIDITGNSTNTFTDRDGQYTWSSIGVPNSTNGQIYWIIPADANNPEIDYPVGKQITQPQGQQTVNYRGNNNVPPFQQTTDNFLLKLDRANCTTSWMGVNPDGSQFVPGN